MCYLLVSKTTLVSSSEKKTSEKKILSNFTTSLTLHNSLVKSSRRLSRKRDENELTLLFRVPEFSFAATLACSAGLFFDTLPENTHQKKKRKCIRMYFHEGVEQLKKVIWCYFVSILFTYRILQQSFQVSLIRVLNVALHNYQWRNVGSSLFRWSGQLIGITFFVI